MNRVEIDVLFLVDACQLAPPSMLYSYEVDPPIVRISTVCRRMASTGLGTENSLETSVSEPPMTSVSIWGNVSSSTDTVLLSLLPEVAENQLGDHSRCIMHYATVILGDLQQAVQEPSGYRMG